LIAAAVLTVMIRSPIRCRHGKPSASMRDLLTAMCE
jgi:hypothetical protein